MKKDLGENNLYAVWAKVYLVLKLPFLDEKSKL